MEFFLEFGGRSTQRVGQFIKFCLGFRASETRLVERVESRSCVSMKPHAMYRFASRLPDTRLYGTIIPRLRAGLPA
jgi:hypothetical protein